MTSVNVGVRSYDNFVVFEVVEIEIVTVSLRETAAKRIDDCFDFLVGKNTVSGLLFDIQNLRVVRYFYRS